MNRRSDARNDATAASWRRLALALLGMSLLLKLWLAHALPLFGDEAFYWLESRHFNWAYDDVPGLTPWLIALGSSLFGPQEWAVRLPFLLVSLLTLALLIHVARSMAGERAGWIAGVIAMLLPLFAVNGLLAIPDVPLSFSVLVCVEGLRRLLRAERYGTVILAAGLVLGWLSHYRFVVPFAAAGIWLLAHPTGRRLLSTRKLWLAGVLGTGSGLAPLLWHQWAGGTGFAFQYVERHPWAFHADGLLDPLWQALVATPLLFLVLLAAAWHACWRERRSDRAMVAGVALSMLGLYLLLGPFVDAERSRLHWTLPALLLASTLVPAGFPAPRRGARWLLRSSVALASAVCGAAFVLLTALAVHPDRLASSAGYLHGFTGWREAARFTDAALSELPEDTLLVADHFTLAAELGFALEPRGPVFSLDHPINRKHGRQGELARMGLDERALFAELPGRPILLIVEESASRLRQRPAWFRRLCERFPGARPLFDISVDHQRKRLIGYFQAAGADSGCVPAALGYLSAPLWGEKVVAGQPLSGWAIRDGEGLLRVRARLGGLPIDTLSYDDRSPSVAQVFPRSTDPRHPNVGLIGSLHSTLPPGRYWIDIEVEAYDGRRAIVASVPVDWLGPPAGPDRPALH